MEAATRPATIRPPSTGPKFAHDADRHDRRHDRLGAEARAPGIDLKRQRAAGEQRRQPDDRKAEVANEQKGLRELSQVEGRTHQMADGQSGEDHDAADAGQELDHRPADGGKDVHPAVSR